MNRKTPRRATLAAALFLCGSALSGCHSAPPAPPRPPHVLTDAAALPQGTRAALDRLFSDTTAMGETRAVLLLKDGVPVYEAYGEGFGPASKLISWSMAKSFTSVIIGMLVADGRLALDQPAPVPAWQRPGDPRGGITLRHLLHMSSGLNHVETGDPAWEADTVTMLFGSGAQDMAAAAEAQPSVARPDEVYNYSSATTIILADIAARALTDSPVAAVRRDAMLNYLDGRLATPLGLSSLTPEFDANGTMIGGSLIHATARDYAKFGEFLRRGGTTSTGQRLIPQSWLTFMLTPAPADHGYGGHIWLNHPRPAGSEQALWPQQGPADLFACLGHQGQFIVVSPSQHLTLVRLGISTHDQIDHVRDGLRDALAGM